jgi:hypothetical protein
MVLLKMIFSPLYLIVAACFLGNKDHCKIILASTPEWWCPHFLMMKSQLGLNLLAVMDARIIENERDTTNSSWDLPLQLGEQGNELFLPLA